LPLNPKPKSVITAIRRFLQYLDHLLPEIRDRAGPADLPFDAPVEQVMYLDKIIVAHTLLQAMGALLRIIHHPTGLSSAMRCTERSETRSSTLPQSWHDRPSASYRLRVVLAFPTSSVRSRHSRSLESFLTLLVVLKRARISGIILLLVENDGPVHNLSRIVAQGTSREEEPPKFAVETASPSRA